MSRALSRLWGRAPWDSTRDGLFDDSVDDEARLTDDILPLRFDRHSQRREDRANGVAGGSCRFPEAVGAEDLIEADAATSTVVLAR